MIKAIIPLLIIALAVVYSGIHKIAEGHVGVYYRFGVLQNVLTGPGYNYRFPLFTSYESVQVSVQTDQVMNIPCVHHEINQFCSKHTLNEVFIDLFDTLDEELIIALQRDLSLWAPGIEIISIRVTKPRIPKILQDKFEEIEKQRSELLITEERQKIEVQQALTSQKQRIMKWQSQLDVTSVNVAQKIQEKVSQLNLSSIKNEIYLNQEKAQADAYYYNSIKELETNKQKFSQQFLFYNAIESLLENSKFAVGEQIPSYISPQELMKNEEKLNGN